MLEGALWLPFSGESMNADTLFLTFTELIWYFSIKVNDKYSGQVILLKTFDNKIVGICVLNWLALITII